MDSASRTAYETMEEAGKKNHLTFESVMTFLLALYFRLYATYVNEAPGVSRDDLVRGLGLGCSKESAETLRNKTFAKMRQVTYKGRTYLCEDHLKMQKGVHLRLYFAFMEEERRFIVGHVGGHLPTLATHKLGLPNNQ